MSNCFIPLLSLKVKFLETVAYVPCFKSSPFIQSTHPNAMWLLTWLLFYFHQSHQCLFQGLCSKYNCQSLADKLWKRLILLSISSMVKLSLLVFYKGSPLLPSFSLATSSHLPVQFFLFLLNVSIPRDSFQNFPPKDYPFPL